MATGPNIPERAMILANPSVLRLRLEKQRAKPVSA